ncbi:MAG: hypothetical protein ACTSR8_05995 [Promethearchaeota archaeon]
MFDVEKFKDSVILQNLLIKLNKFINKNKTSKVLKLIEELKFLLEDENLVVPVSYIFSILAENEIEYISEQIVVKVYSFLRSENIKLKLNSIIIIGFYLIHNPEKINIFFQDLIYLIGNKESQDIRDNIHFFLHKFLKFNPTLLKGYKNLLIKALRIETNSENILSLLTYLIRVKTLNFKQTYLLREILKKILETYTLRSEEKIFKKIIEVMKKFFPSLAEKDLLNLKNDKIIDLLDNELLMKKYNLRELSKKKKIPIKDLIKSIKRGTLRNKELFFYTSIGEGPNRIIYFYELEKDKILEYFTKITKISLEKLAEKFQPIIEDEKELKSFIRMLIKLNHLDGHLSKFYFYTSEHIKNEIADNLKNKGLVNIKNYEKFLPPDFVKKIINELASESKQTYLLGKNGSAYYSLKSIQQQINETAAKNNSIDLKAFRDRLTDEHFIKLIKKLPKEYLTNYHKGTIWLTNIGKNKIIREIENSKILGFFDLAKISEKLNIRKMLLMDVIEVNIDNRSGIWNINKEIFYYSKYITEKIDKISSISNEEEKQIKINKLARELNINKNHIITKIDENYQLIGEEIKSKEQISIAEYREKTGMNNELFFKFIDDLGLEYLKKGDLLIFSEQRIEEAQNQIKSMLIKKSETENKIKIGNFEIKQNIVENLIKDLENNDKIKGIFYEEGDELVFYTKKGIQALMMEDTSIFCFQDLFYNKELNEKDISLIKEAFNELIKTRKLKGKFDEETLTFSSEEVIFASDYNTVVDDFGKLINGFIKNFDHDFQIIKKTLIKKHEIIYPQEIKVIQDVIDRINLNYVKWRAQMDSFIMTANKRLLKEQGYTLKRYQGLAKDKKEEIKLFKEDLDVYEIVNNFEAWVKLFNDLELNYGKIIFLQKKLINNPEDTEVEQKLDELLINLSLI